MLGHRVAGVLAEAGHKVGVTVRQRDPLLGEAVPAARQIPGVMAEDIDSVTLAMDGFGPDAVVNCIGIVKQKDEAKAAVPSIRVNALFPHQMAAVCAAASIRMVHVSTDCVFSGSRGGYDEKNVPDATDLYGRSKLLGEVTDVTGVVTLRTSIIGWELRNPTGLLEWFARQRGGACGGYRRAVFSGLSTRELGNVVESLISTHRTLDGLWHVSADAIDKFDLLTRMNGALDWNVEVAPIDEPVIDRSLDSARFRAAAEWAPPSWDAMVAGLAGEWPRYGAFRRE
jgi:dTDP-4-dehydrorhamnose reductase